MMASAECARYERGYDTLCSFALAFGEVELDEGLPRMPYGELSPLYFPWYSTFTLQ